MIFAKGRVLKAKSFHNDPRQLMNLWTSPHYRQDHDSKDPILAFSFSPSIMGSRVLSMGHNKNKS